MNLRDHDLNMTISEATQKDHFLSDSNTLFALFPSLLSFTTWDPLERIPLPFHLI